MQYDTQDAFLTDAFSVVRRVDPEAYARISADNTLWTTSPVAMFRHGIAGGIDPATMYRETVDSVGTSFGWTLSDRDETTDLRVKSPLVFINKDACEAMAPEKGIDPVNLAASVIVHEFYHVHQVDAAEQPAYQAQIAFARKMGGTQGIAIVRAEAATARQVATFQGR